MAPVLALYNPNKEYIIETNVSNYVSAEVFF